VVHAYFQPDLSRACIVIIGGYTSACINVRIRVSYVYRNGAYMAYEVYKRTAARVEIPTVSIVPDGRIAINAAGVRILAAAGIKSMLFLWDRESHKIAIKAAQKGDKNAFAVSISPGRSGSLRAKSFLSFVGWNGHKREMLPATWNEREKMFEVTLPSEHLIPEEGGNSKRKTSGT
jgi:hypothetical protein